MTPEENRKRRERYATDAGYRERVLAANAARHKRRYETCPEFRERMRLRVTKSKRAHPGKQAAYLGGMRAKAKLFDALLPILASGNAKALEKMRRQLVKMSKALA